MATDQAFRFLQISNVWLDCKRMGALGFPADLKRQRAEEIALSFEKTLSTSINRGIEAIFIIGNLWDGEIVNNGTIDRVVKLFNELQNLPIFIVPGSGDTFSLDSPYCMEFLRSIGLSAFSSNVHIFAESQFMTVRHPYREDVTVTARSFLKDRANFEWSLSVTPPADHKGLLNILLFAEPVDGLFDPTRHRQLLEQYGTPTSESDLTALGFDYVGIGFGDSPAELHDANDNLIGCQSGSMFAQNLSDAGPRVGVLASLQKSEAGCVCEIETIESDERKIYATGADVSGLDSEDALQEIIQTLEDEGARVGEDIAYIELEGRLSDHPKQLIDSLKQNFYHAFVADRTRPDYLSKTYAAGSPEARFTEAMLVLKRDPATLAAVGVTTVDGVDINRILEDALYYGLDALQQKRVNLRNVD